MDTILVKNIRCYAFHGCMEEEARIGSDYRVDIMVKADLMTSCLSDALTDTVDYVSLHRIAREQMAIRAKLLETVAHRIVESIFEQHKEVQSVRVEVQKYNPPIEGEVAAVSVRLKRKRNER